MRTSIDRLGMGAAGTITVIFVLIIWEILCRSLNIREIILPLPSQIFYELWINASWYAGNTLYTLWITVAGFAVAVTLGILIAICLVGSRLFERFFYPLIVGFNSVPKVALAPLFVVWMGTGAEPKITISCLIAIFAIIVGTVQGLRSVPSDIVDLSTVLRGSKMDFFFKIRLPCALPSMLAGMKVAMALALVGEIVGEFVSAQRGLGFIILSAQGVFDTVRVFASLFILAVLGLALYGLVAWIERMAMPWRDNLGGE